MLNENYSEINLLDRADEGYQEFFEDFNEEIASRHGIGFNEVFSCY